MESVCVVAGATDWRLLLARCRAALSAVTPGAGSRLVEREWALDEIRGGVARVGPEAPEFESLVDVHATDAALAVVFGDLTGFAAPARVVHELHGAGGDWCARVRALDGVFAAVVVDRRSREVTALCDVTGCRSLLYHAHDGVLLVSPHAAGPIGTGRIPLRWDETSVASLTCVDWSIGRRPLLRELRTLKPFETLRFRDGDLAIETHSPFSFDDRIDRRDERALDAHEAALVEAMVDATRSYGRDRSEITLSLTRGLDSRAVLGLLRAAGLHDRLSTQTSGLPDSGDVRGAQKLAAICGVPHVRSEPPRPTRESFEAHLRLIAFLNNGETNGKRALSRLPGLAHAGGIGGGGGEIFTGMYYPLFVPFGRVPDDPEHVASTFMQRARRGRWSAVDAWDSPLRRKTQERMVRELATFQSFGAKAADLVDLFYLWERYAGWGAMGFRQPWAHGWTPFTTPEAVHGLFRYPRAAAKYCTLQARIIREHLPWRAYLMPVNGTSWLPLRRRGQGAYLVGQAQLALSLVDKKVAATRKSRAREADVEQIRARMFATDVYDFVHARLTSTSSLATATFGAAATGVILDSHRRHRDQLQPLGALLLADEFRLIAERAYRTGTALR